MARRTPTALDDAEAPLLFARNVCGMSSLVPFQQRILSTAWTNRRTAVASGHGMGKGHVGGLLVLSFGMLLPKPLVVVTAPTGRQAGWTIWGELQAQHQRLAHMRHDLDGTSIQLDLSRHNLNESDWKVGGQRIGTHYAIRPTEQTAFQGLHSPQIMVMIDEAAGVDDRIFNAAQTLVTGEASRLVLLGNPTNPGFFQDCFRADSGWATVSASCFEHPNVLTGQELVPGAVTRMWIDDMWQEHGDGDPIKWPQKNGEHAPIMNLPAWREWPRLSAWSNVWWVGRVMGRFPEEGDNSLIRYSWILRACSLDVPADGETSMGVDVARYGKDLTVLVVMRGLRVVYVEEHAKTSGPDVVGHIHRIASEYGVRPENIAVDTTGIGGMGVRDWLDTAPNLTDLQRSLWRSVREETFGASPQEPRFANRKAELVWGLRDLLERGVISLAGLDSRVQESLSSQLRMMRFEFRAGGKIAVEPKDEYRKRTGCSPDHAEALALAASVAREHEVRASHASMGIRGVMADIGIHLAVPEKPRWDDLSFEDEYGELPKEESAPEKGPRPWTAK